jgi:hypothetical protein
MGKGKETYSWWSIEVVVSFWVEVLRVKIGYLCKQTKQKQKIPTEIGSITRDYMES